MIPDRQWKQLMKCLEANRDEPKACVICGMPTQDRGMFFPNDSVSWGAAEGKQRVVVYPFCNRHDIKAVDADVEKKIADWLKSVGRLPNATHHAEADYGRPIA